MCPQGGAREEPRVVAAEGGARFGPDAVTAACGEDVRPAPLAGRGGGAGGRVGSAALPALGRPGNEDTLCPCEARDAGKCPDTGDLRSL